MGNVQTADDEKPSCSQQQEVLRDYEGAANINGTPHETLENSFQGDEGPFVDELHCRGTDNDAGLADSSSAASSSSSSSSYSSTASIGTSVTMTTSAGVTLTKSSEEESILGVKPKQMKTMSHEFMKLSHISESPEQCEVTSLSEEGELVSGKNHAKFEEKEGNIKKPISKRHVCKEDIKDVLEDLRTVHKYGESAYGRLASIIPEAIDRATHLSGCFSRRKHQQSRARKLHEEMQSVRKEMEMFLSCIVKLEDWLETDENVSYYLEVVLTLQYMGVVLSISDDKFTSLGRIKCKYYKAEYDGITLEKLTDSFSNRYITWHTHGDLKLFLSQIRGLNEVMQMFIHKACCEPDNYIMRIVSGEIDLEKEDHIEVVSGLYDEDSAARNLTKFFNALMIANASVYEMYFEEDQAARCAGFMRGLTYFGILKHKRGKHRGQVTFTSLGSDIQEQLEFIQYVWNLPDKKAVSDLWRIGLPPIKHSFSFKIEGHVNARFISDESTKVLPNEFDKPDALEKAKPQRAIILHFHGGGFISSSATAHETYTRSWAKHCKSPMISVDYSLSPEAKFPTALDEAFTAYRWCREVACKMYKTDRVVVTGDSAGGTLSTALIVKCIMEDYPIPDGALLSYPAVDIRRSFFPSLLWSLNDRLLPYTFLLSCLSAYLGTQDPEEMLRICDNPQASPNVASDEILSKFPPTYLIAAASDPLFDRTVEFAHRLSIVLPKGNTKLYVVPRMAHGFLCFNIPSIGIPEVGSLIELCSDLLENLVEGDFEPNSAQQNKTLNCRSSPASSSSGSSTSGSQIQE